jgi:LacI family transcriptional regulator
MRDLLKLKPRPDAVFCYNDMTAIGAVEAVLDAGLRVPEDIAVIGCGNLRYASYLRVPLSAIDQHTAELGKRAAQLAVELAERPQSELKCVLVPPRLIARESTVGKRRKRTPLTS